MVEDPQNSKFAQAVSAHREGDLDRAEKLYIDVLETNEFHPDANHNFGLLLMVKDRVSEAISHFLLAIHSNPKIEQFWISYLSLIIKVDDKEFLQKAATLTKSRSFTNDRINALISEVNRRVLAKVSIQSIDNGFVEEISKLSAKSAIKLALRRIDDGNTDNAREILQYIANKYPGNRSAKRILRGLAKTPVGENDKVDVTSKVEFQALVSQFKEGKFETVLEKAKEALRQYPNSIELLNLTGVTSCRLGLFQQGIEIYDKILAFDPDNPEVLYNKGNAYRDSGKGKEALECFLKAISIKPDHAKALYNTGHMLAGVRRYERAIDYYEKALSVIPDYFDATFNLANAYNNLGDYKRALPLYEKASKLNVSDFRYQIAAAFVSPSVPLDEQEITNSRKRIIDNCAQLAKLKLHTKAEVELLSDPRFQLSYSDRNNKTIFTLMSNVLRQKFPQLNKEPIGLMNRYKRDKIKVGFCSNFLAKNHTIEKLFRGIICNLDPEIFDVTVIHHSEEKKRIAASSFGNDNVAHIGLDIPFSQKVEKIRDLDLDTLIFPDLGMDGLNYTLSHMRLAENQLTSWGHPDTTGVSTIDGFISSSLIEPINCKANYSENLFLFPTLPSFYSVDPNIKLSMKRSEFGFDNHQRLYGCLQTLFKIHPNFDLILNEITLLDQRSAILFIDSPLTKALVQRWREKGLDNLISKSIFLKPLSHGKYINLLNLCDVLLDPLYFGSGNSFYEGAFCGTPQVSSPGSFMRGRIVLGGYIQMGLGDVPTVDKHSLYARTAVDWANSRDRQIAFKNKCQESARDSLFNDTKVIRAYEEILQELRESS